MITIGEKSPFYWKITHYGYKYPYLKNTYLYKGKIVKILDEKENKNG